MKNIMKSVSKCTSIITADLYGILEPINYNVNVVDEGFLLATDSKNKLHAIGTKYPNSPIIQKFKR